MATRLNVNTGGEDAGKKLWKKHQSNEFTKVTNYKEAVCLNCLKKDVALATIAVICQDCAGKRGREALLAVISTKYYGLCLFCGKHKFNLEEINARFCMPCHRRIANVTRDYNKKGGQMGTDPFWQHLRKKHGKDYKEIFNQGWLKRK